MKPVAEFDQGVEGVLNRVALVPSHEGGHFVIDHSYYGKQIVDKVVLLGVAEEDVDMMHAADEFPLDKYIATDEYGNSATTERVGAQVSILFNRGSGNSVNMVTHSFREFAPVAAETPATV